jgi:Mg-chelatase subunit ChlD
MSLDSTPQDEMEARLTALLLGELSAREEAVVREAIAKDPALAQLHARLQLTIGLVREAARSVAEETAAPAPALQLSKERREKMLRSFKVIKPQPSAWARWRKIPMRDVSSVAAMLVVLGLMAWGLFGGTLAGEKNPQRTTAIPGIRALSDAVLSYQRKYSATSSRGELVESLGEQDLALHDAPAVVNSPQPVAAEPDRTLRAPVVGRSSSARQWQSTVNWGASGPEATTPPPPAEVAHRGNRSVILPALTDPSPALGDNLASVNLWAENQPSATPRGEVRDLQRGSEPIRAALIAGTTPAREPLSADGFTSTGLSDSTPQLPALAMHSTNQFIRGFRNTVGGFGGGGIGGSANALGWFSQTPAQPDNSTWRFAAPADSGATANRSGEEARLNVALATTAAPVAAPAAVAPENFYFNGRAVRIDNSVAKGAETRFGNLQADDHDFVATTPVDGSGDVAARGLAPAPTIAPTPALPQKPQSAQSPGELAQVVAANGTVHFHDVEAQNEYSGSQLPPQSKRGGGADRFKLNTELGISGRSSGTQPLRESKRNDLKAIQVEDEVMSQSLTRSDGRALRTEALDRLQTANSLEDKKDSRSLAETDGGKEMAGKPVAVAVVPSPALPAITGGVYSKEAFGFVNAALSSKLVPAEQPVVETVKAAAFDTESDETSKKAEAALQASEHQSSRYRIHLPEVNYSKPRLERESQVQTGPVSGSEVELRNVITPREKLATVAQQSGSKPSASSGVREKAERAVDAKAIAGLTHESFDDGVIGGINKEANFKRPATAPIPQPEVTTSENAFSTFSLNVSDVSFKLAAAALEKGQVPDPATVRSEEFINAFDYRDPEPAGSAPIAFAWERARYPFAHDRDLVRFSVKTAASGRQPGRPLNLVLLLDNSGSMERADRIRIRQECLRVLAGQLQPQDRVSVVAFARTARLWVDGLPGNQAGELPQRVGGLTPEGGTNLEDAMNLAYQTARRHFLANGVNRVVLLTDGAANLGDVQPESLKKKVEANRQQGVALDCFGIGWEGYNDDLLEALSRNGDGRYGFINTPEAASSEFASQLAGALKVSASDVKVQVEWNPRRVTAYRQVGYAKHQLKKEQFRDNTVDAAEIGAAEAGNALYTVQVNPAGEGPLGTMRVRFKVPGTSDYREHEWPLPYEGAAKSLDQSSATLRLAASASAFSEWLVSSPFAAEVTPDKLLGYLGNVPEAFSADPRPKKLEWMIRQAKSVAGK